MEIKVALGYQNEKLWNERIPGASGQPIELSPELCCPPIKLRFLFDHDMPKTTIQVPADLHENSRPNLMPFHIAYSGPAPISTYFMPRPFEEEKEEEIRGAEWLERPGLEKSGLSEMTEKLHVGTEEDGSNVTEDASSPSNRNHNGLLKNGTEKFANSTCYEAAFRGRKVVGQDILVPQGYTGVILAIKDKSNRNKGLVDEEAGVKTKAKDAKAKASERAKALKAKAATKLKGKGSRYEEYSSDEEGKNGEAGRVLATDANEPQQRDFEVVKRFDRYRVWNPDIPVVEDEYVRAMRDWVTVSQEVSTPWIFTPISDPNPPDSSRIAHQMCILPLRLSLHVDYISLDGGGRTNHEIS